MTKQFRENVDRLFVKPETSRGRMVHAALGIATEAGEIGTTIKAYWIYGKPLDVTNLIEEVGDLLFYVQALANEAGFTLEDCMEANVEKLILRYPDGYSDQAAIERADKG